MISNKYNWLYGFQANCRLLPTAPNAVFAQVRGFCRTTFRNDWENFG